MIPCNGKHRTEGWYILLCKLGIHMHGRTDGGGMGDAYQCHVCGLDSYCDWSLTPPFIVHDESKETENATDQ